jgi:hypothetical protein
MMIIKRTVIVLLIIITTNTPVFADRFSSWGSINYKEQEGFRFACSFKEGFPVGGLMLYVNLEIEQSSKREQIWNNRITPAIGIEYSFPLTLFKGADWQNYTIGGRGRVRIYTDVDEQSPELYPYFNWGFGGRLNENLPYSSWGNLKHTDAEGVYLDTAYKQGFQFNRIVPYIELGLTQSSIREHYWDNKVTALVGLEYILPISLFKGWEDYRIGVRAGYEFATDDDRIEFTWTFYFFKWSFGGLNLIERTF